MKNVQISSRKLMIAILGLVLSLSSCEYLDIADAKYPEQLIYMPAAKHNIFYINSVSSPIGNTTPGSNYRYIVDVTGNGFKIPLGVYRSGIDNKGAFKVDIVTVTDTITKLQAPGQPLEGTKILSPALFSIPNSVEMPDGGELAPFDLTVRLDSLVANYARNTVFAIGVRISSTARDANPDLATTIIVIDSKMMKPTAGFTFKPDDANPKKVTFTNESLMGLSYEWDFGDNTVSTETSPVHTYNAAGTYTVKLKALGVTGEQDKSIKSTDVTIL